MAAALLTAAHLAAPAARTAGPKLYLPLLQPPADWPHVAPSVRPRPSATASLTRIPAPPTGTTAPSRTPVTPTVTNTAIPLPSPGPTLARQDLRWVGELGGAGSAVAVTGHAAYLGEGRRMVAVDTSDPARLRRAGEAGPFPGPVRDLVIAGGRLLVAAGEGGLWVVDLTDPLAPRVMGGLATTGDARALVVVGALVCVADGPGGLLVVDVSDPSAPRAAGHLDTRQPANDVALDGERAFVAVADASSAGLVVVDLSDPARPRELGAAPSPGTALAVAAARGHAYLADGGEGLHVFEVAQASRPRRVATLSGDVHAILLLGREAILTGRKFTEGFGLRIVDLSQPESPRLTTTIQLGSEVRAMTWRARRLFVATDSTGMEVLSDPIVGLLGPVAVLDEPGLWAHEVAVDGDRAYVMDGRTVRVIDISDPAKPRELGRAPAPTKSVVGDPFLGRIVADREHAYIASSVAGLMILDATRPREPRWVEVPSLGGRLRSVEVRGGRGYLVDEQSRDLLILELALPASPQLSGRVPIPCQPTHVTAAGDITWVACSGTRLLAFDLTDPQRPRTLGSLGELGTIIDMAIQGRFAYLSQFESLSSLRVVDLGDPATPREVGRVPLGTFGGRLGVLGSAALIVKGSVHLTLLDVGDPAAPKEMGEVMRVHDLADVTAGATSILVADGEGGLQIFEAAAP